MLTVLLALGCRSEPAAVKVRVEHVCRAYGGPCTTIACFSDQQCKCLNWGYVGDPECDPHAEFVHKARARAFGGGS